MKAITWLAAMTMSVAAITSTAYAESAAGWSTDLKASIALAKKENKSVLINFTGSDWCPPCMFMHKNVLGNNEFISVASKQFVLVEIDLPEGDQKLKEKNTPLVKKYKIEGFPTVILLDSEGIEFSRFFANRFPKVDLFLANLDKILENKELD